MSPRARQGDGARYKEKSSGLWAVAIELPPVRWNADGKPVRNRKVQRFKSRAEADKALRELREQKRQMGTLPTVGQTVEGWFTKWLNVHVIPNERPRTADTYRMYVTAYIIPALGASTRLAKLTPDSIRNIEAFITARGLSRSTARNAYHYAAHALDDAMRDGLLLSNPARRVEAPRRRKPDLDVFTVDDAIKLLNHLTLEEGGALWAAYLLTGARRGEIAGLEFDRVGDHLDLSWQLQRLVYVHGCGGTCGRKRAGNCPDRRMDMPEDYEARQVSGGLYLTRPKSQAGWRIIPLVEPLRTILFRHMAVAVENPWGLLFAGLHGRYGTVIPPDPDRFTNDWPRLRDEVFGPGRRVRLHDVRHTTVDLLYAANVPEDVISSIVGHSNRSMTRAYKSRTDLARLQDAMNRLSGLVTPQAIERTPETTE